MQSKEHIFPYTPSCNLSIQIALVWFSKVSSLHHNAKMLDGNSFVFWVNCSFSGFETIFSWHFCKWGKRAATKVMSFTRIHSPLQAGQQLHLYGGKCTGTRWFINNNSEKKNTPHFCFMTQVCKWKTRRSKALNKLSHTGYLVMHLLYVSVVDLHQENA